MGVKGKVTFSCSNCADRGRCQPPQSLPWPRHLAVNSRRRSNIFVGFVRVTWRVGIQYWDHVASFTTISAQRGCKDKSTLPLIPHPHPPRVHTAAGTFHYHLSLYPLYKYPTGRKYWLYLTALHSGFWVPMAVEWQDKKVWLMWSCEGDRQIGNGRDLKPDKGHNAFLPKAAMKGFLLV